MSTSLTVWKSARSPNYDDNEDLYFPYSEVPYIGEYNLVKIPLSLDDLIEHVDYWGEGRLVTEHGDSGFKKSYNVNHQFQVISWKIPNRIPVLSYTNCDTSGYIKNDSVKVVTLMGAPINKSCAKDIARIVNGKLGKVIIYGIKENTADENNIATELKSVGLFYCYGYQLPDALNKETLFDSHRAYLNRNDYQEELFKKIAKGDYGSALKITETANSNHASGIFIDVVTKLMKDGVDGKTNLMSYTYKLWTGGAKEIVESYFPEPFKFIFNETNIVIINHHKNLLLKLDSNTDDYGDRLAWGDASDRSSVRVKWNMIPFWEEGHVYFKIKNVEHGTYLKMDVNQDEYGDRKVWGAALTGEMRYKWNLEPCYHGNEILFYIINKEYDQGLKLDANVDYYGDRLLWGSQNTVFGNPSYFGWIIAENAS